MKKIRSVINVILFFVIFMMIFKCVSSVFRTMDSGDIENINGFYMEEKNSIDVFFIGPSEFYTGYALVTACRAEVTIYMKENNLKGYYILTGMAKV